MEINEDYGFCSKCGAKLTGNASFCPMCGAPTKYCRPSISIEQAESSTPNAGTVQPKRKDKIVAGLLAIFLGNLGVQYFYTDKVTAGLISIVLALCTCGIWQLLTLIQGIIMMTMTDEEFQAKYVDTEKTMPLF